MEVPLNLLGKLNSKPKKQFSRRDFLKVSAILGLDTFLLGLTGASYAWNVEPTWMDINRVTLKLPRLPRAFSGMRLAQISDVHLGPWMSPERFREIISLMTAQAPDLVALTGDYVLALSHGPSYTAELREMTHILAELTSQFPVVAVMGNHDYWYNAFEVSSALEKGGVHLLMNTVYTLEKDGEKLHLAGLDDIYEQQQNLDAVLAQLPGSDCAILLAHEPDFADASAATGRFDLQISGHSHGGQVVLPLIGPPILPDLGRKYPSGLYKVGNMYQYTTRGVGTSLPPVRFNCRPEITVLTLESA